MHADSFSLKRIGNHERGHSSGDESPSTQRTHRSDDTKWTRGSQREATTYRVSPDTRLPTDEAHATLVERFQVRRTTHQYPRTLSTSLTATSSSGVDISARTRKFGEPTIELSPRQESPLARFLLPLTRNDILQTLSGLIAPTSPFSLTLWFRQHVVLAAFALQIISSPVGIAFSMTDVRPVVVTVVKTVDMIFAIDLLLHLNTATLDRRKNVPITTRSQIVQRYMKTWFVSDLVACLPIELAFTMTAMERVTLSWLCVGLCILRRLPKCYRAVQLIHQVERARPLWSSPSLVSHLLYSRYTHLVNVVWIVAMIFTMAHYTACCWQWLQPDSSVKSTFTDQYTHMLFNALQLLLGQGINTTTGPQNIFAVFTMLVGSIVLAVVFGHVTVLVANFNANSTSHQGKLESVYETMAKMRLPLLLRERIHEYYEYLWREYESLDGEIVKFTKDLSHTLELEVILYKYMDLVMHVPFWRDCTPDFQKQLMLHLQVRIYLPDDYILRRGEVGDEFYMINRGICEVVLGPDSFECTICPLREEATDKDIQTHGDSLKPLQSTETRPEPQQDQSSRRSKVTDTGIPSKTTVLRLNRGQTLGEMALLMNYERTADARAVTYVEMCVLSRDAFQSILLKHPKDRRQVLTQIVTKTVTNNADKNVKCPLMEAVNHVFQGERDVPVSPVEAGSLLAEAIDVEKADESITFGLGGMCSCRIKRCSAPPAVDTRCGKLREVISRVEAIEFMQAELTQTAQEIRREVAKLHVMVGDER